MMMPPNPGTRRTPRAAKREAARRSTYAAPVAMGCSIVLRPTSQTYKIPKQGAGKSVDYPRLAGVYCFFKRIGRVFDWSGNEALKGCLRKRRLNNEWEPFARCWDGARAMWGYG